MMQLVYKLKTSPKVAFCADDMLLSYDAENASLKFWDMTTGKCTATIKPPRRSPKSETTRGMVVTPDGKTLLVGQEDGSIWVWDTASEPGLRYILKAHTERAISLAAFPDSSRFLSTSFDGTLKVWEQATGECVQTLALPAGLKQRVLHCALSPDARQALTGHQDGTICVWDLEANTCIDTLTAHTDTVRWLLFSHDGRHFFSGSEDTTVKVWESASRSCVRTLEGHRKGITHLALTPDGTRLTSAGYMDNSFRVWDWRTGICLLDKFYGYIDRGSPYTLTFSPSGTWLAIDAWLELRVYRLGLRESIPLPATTPTPPTLVHQIKAHSGEIQRMAFHPGGQLVTYGEQDKQLKFWDMASGSSTLKLKRFRSDNPVTTHALAITPDGRHIITGYANNTLAVWDTQFTCPLDTHLKGHQALVCTVAAFADNLHVLSGSYEHRLKVWNILTGVCIQTLTYPITNNNHVYCVTVSPDDRFALSGHSDGSLRLWELATGTCTVTLTGHPYGVTSVAFLPDGQHMASGARDGTVKIWDQRAGTCVRTLEHKQGFINDIALSPEGKVLASVGFTGAVRLWDWRTGACLQELNPDDLRSLYPYLVAFSPDGQWLAVSSISANLALYRLVNVAP